MGSGRRKHAIRVAQHTGTEQFGEEVAKSLRGGDVLAFTGSLGMGKTAFTRGLARGLGAAGASRAQRSPL